MKPPILRSLLLIAKGKTPEGMKIAQNHARIISGFVDKGPAQMHETHPRARGADKGAARPESAKAVCPACAAKAEPGRIPK